MAGSINPMFALYWFETKVYRLEHFKVRIGSRLHGNTQKESYK